MGSFDDRKRKSRVKCHSRGKKYSEAVKNKSMFWVVVTFFSVAAFPLTNSTLFSLTASPWLMEKTILLEQVPPLLPQATFSMEIWIEREKTRFESFILVLSHGFSGHYLKQISFYIGCGCNSCGSFYLKAVLIRNNSIQSLPGTCVHSHV